MLPVSVIIPALNAAESLPATLKSIQQQDYPRDRIEIVVVDNGSSDGTADVATSFGARVIHVTPRNRSIARNSGVKASSGKLLYFIDADCQVSPNFIRGLADRLRDKSIGVVQGAVSRVSSKTGRQLAKQQLFKGHLGVPFIDTCGIGMRRELFYKAKGFDQTLPRCEDIDFSVRILQLGYSIRLESKVDVKKLVAYSWSSALTRGMEHAEAFASLHQRWPQQFVVSNRTATIINWRSVCKKLRRTNSKLAGITPLEWSCSLLQSIVIFGAYPFYRRQKNRELDPRKKQPPPEEFRDSRLYYLVENIFVAGIDYSAMLIFSSKGYVRELNQSGRIIISTLLRSPASLEVLGQALVDEYGCDRDKARRDVLIFLESISEDGLLLSEPETGPSSPISELVA